MAELETLSISREGKRESSDRYLEAHSFSSAEMRSYSETKDGSASRLDWTAALSPIERSCIDLTTIEPCVNKAVANLESLKETLSLKASREIEPVLSASPTQRRPSTATLVARLKAAESEDSNLSVEGVRTGVMLDKFRRYSLAKKVSS